MRRPVLVLCSAAVLALAAGCTTTSGSTSSGASAKGAAAKSHTDLASCVVGTWTMGASDLKDLLNEALSQVTETAPPIDIQGDVTLVIAKGGGYESIADFTASFKVATSQFEQTTKGTQTGTWTLSSGSLVTTITKSDLKTSVKVNGQATSTGGSTSDSGVLPTGSLPVTCDDTSLVMKPDLSNGSTTETTPAISITLKRK